MPPEAHAAFYGAQRFTLNVTRTDMIAAGWSPSVRLFEAASCGTPIISDRWPGLTSLFPEDEAILIADDTETVLSVLTSPDAARPPRIARRALGIVRNAHTGAARARALENYIAACAASRLWTPSRLPETAGRPEERV